MKLKLSLRDLYSKILHLKLNQNYNVETGVAEWKKIQATQHIHFLCKN